MSIDFSTPEKVKSNIIYYIEGILSGLPSDLDETGTVNTLAANHIFEVNTVDPQLLSEDKKQIFHHIVPQLLFLCK